jgi:hypothetical protein
MTSTDLAVVESGGYLALNHSPEEVQAVIRRSVGTDEISEFDLPRVKIPSGGGKTWEIPTLGGVQGAPVLEGVLLHFKTTRAYWSNPDPTGEPPQCRSDNGVIGVGDPGGRCKTCPLAQFGSDSKHGRGQACNQYEIWFLLRPDMFLPLVIRLPATSLGAAKDYRIGTLAAHMLAPEQVLTRIGLEQDSNDDGQKYSRAVPSVAGMLEPEEAARALAYAEAFRPLFDAAAQAVTVEDETGDTVGPAPGAAAPPTSTGFAERETDEERAEQLAERYGDTIPEA